LTRPKSDLRAILEAAVKMEEQSHTLYTFAQKKVDSDSSREFLKELAGEELKHKQKLLTIIEDREKISELGSGAGKIRNLKIVDSMKDVALDRDADYQKILIYAAKREKATHDYYDSLARGMASTDLGSLLSKLAEEELNHKNRLETEYDESILREN
jgi:rubrerythrin